MENQNADSRRVANGLAIASLVMGILAIVTSIFMIGIIFAGLGISFALLSRGAGSMHGVAIGGLVCSIVALIISFLVLVFLGIFMAAGMGAMYGFSYYY